MFYELPENWKDMPVKTVLVAGVKRQIKYDSQTQTLYMLDSTGNWTGEKAKTQLTPAEILRQHSANQEEDGDQDTEPAVAGTGDVPEEKDAVSDGAAPAEDANAKKKAPKKKKKLTTGKLLLIVLAIIAVFLGISVFRTAEEINPTKYTVIVAAKDLRPGDRLSGNLASIVIPADEYHAVTSGIYKAAAYKTIENYVATAYISKYNPDDPSGDSFITYNNVDKVYEPANPWKQGGTVNYINVPVNATNQNLGNFMWGNQVTVTITTKKTISSTPNADVNIPTTEQAQGNSVIQTVRVDTYNLTNLTIIDVLDQNQRSLYSSYASMIAIPSGYLNNYLANYYSSRSNISKDTPSYIQLAISPETYTIWKKLNENPIAEITVAVTGTHNETELQRTVHEDIEIVIPAIKKAWYTKQNED